MSELPYHIIHPMPALSPTMETGTIASWYLKEGDSFSAGDAMAKIETDKASIDFEAQDDGYIAKILVKEGSEDVTVGSPIMVTVEDADAVAAFQDFVLPAAAAAAAPATPAVVAAAPEEPVKAAPAVSTPAVVTPPPPPSVPAAVVTPPPAPIAAPAAPPPLPPTSSPITLGPAWGSSARVTSPIAKTLSNQQKAYIALYG
jgi:pyruvate dehydrogenase E2 component (dihydrolipoamide acetyltransferase)